MRLILLSDPDVPDPDGNFAPAHRLAVELRRRGTTVLQATPREPGRPPIERIEGVPVRRLAVHGEVEGILRMASFEIEGRLVLRRWLRELRDRPPDLFHAHLSGPAVWLAAHAAAALKAPWVLTAAGGHAERTLRSRRVMTWIGRYLGTASALVAPSEGILRKVSHWVPDGAERAVIPPGVDPIAADLPAAPIILGIGRLEAGKGFAVLIRAFSILRRQRPEATLVIAGEGPERRRLEGLRGSLPPEIAGGIRWEEAASRETVDALIAAARIVAFPGRRGGFEFTAARAMAAGRAVVVARADGEPLHAVDGGNAVVVPAGDSSALAEALLGLIDDPAQAERIGHGGRGTVMRNAAWPAVADRYLEVFRLALKKAGT
jgi:glycosyltransferase involved in cell wall biosynthesis